MIKIFTFNILLLIFKFSFCPCNSTTLAKHMQARTHEQTTYTKLCHKCIEYLDLGHKQFDNHAFNRHCKQYYP